MNEHDTEDIGPHGGIPLTARRYINFWYSNFELFGAEKSTNAAGYFATGVKGVRMVPNLMWIMWPKKAFTKWTF